MKKTILFLSCLFGAAAIVVAQAQNNEAKVFALSSGHNESCVTFTPDGKTAYVTVVEPDAVLKINLDSGEVTGRVETGSGPDGIAVAGT